MCTCVRYTALPRPCRNFPRLSRRSRLCCHLLRALLRMLYRRPSPLRRCDYSSIKSSSKGGLSCQFVYSFGWCYHRAIIFACSPISTWSSSRPEETRSLEESSSSSTILLRRRRGRTVLVHLGSRIGVFFCRDAHPRSESNMCVVLATLTYLSGF